MLKESDRDLCLQFRNVGLSASKWQPSASQHEEALDLDFRLPNSRRWEPERWEPRGWEYPICEPLVVLLLGHGQVKLHPSGPTAVAAAMARPPELERAECLENQFVLELADGRIQRIHLVCWNFLRANQDHD